jgi:c-di-GMP-binding flagellar brake protein YcgR
MRLIKAKNMNINNNYGGVDRRKYPRVNASVTYSIENTKLDDQFKQTKNISAGGIAFFARDPLEVGSILCLDMDLPDMSSVQTKARVVWREHIKIPEDEKICCELGVEFIEVDDKIRKKISKYVFLRLDTN